jgi:hypothetical protein
MRDDKYEQVAPCTLLLQASRSQTIFSSFFLAAQRAVWDKPQSGATESFSFGTYFRQRLMRSFTSSTVSM